MRSLVNLVFIAAVSIISIPAAADGSNWLRVGNDGWIPSLAITGGVDIQKQTSSIDIACERGGTGIPPFTVPGFDGGFAACQELSDELPPTSPYFMPLPSMGPLRPSASGSNQYVAPTLGFDLEIATPQIDPIPGNPRFFFRGEIELFFGVKKNVANEGNPDVIHLPVSKNGTVRALTITPTSSLLGQGSRTSSETQLLGWGAGAGIAFPFELFGRRLWVKPGAAWSRRTVDVQFFVSGATKNDPSAVPVGGFLVVGDQLREITLDSTVSHVYDGIGPSLEIEMDVGQFGPVGASIFVNGAAYAVLGDREIEFSQSASFEATAPTWNGQELKGLADDTYTGNWTFEVEPWFYRANMGIRFNWYGF